MADERLDIRDATADDAAVIAQIYNQGIEDRQATLETRLRAADERREWLAARGPRHPALVALADGAVCGWASLNQFSPRAAYDQVADISVYVARAWRGQGVGGALLRALEQRARTLGFHKLVLAGLTRNRAAITLYKRNGFQQVGVYHEQGILDGQWVDVILMEKLLA